MIFEKLSLKIFCFEVRKLIFLEPEEFHSLFCCQNWPITEKKPLIDLALKTAKCLRVDLRIRSKQANISTFSVILISSYVVCNFCLSFWCKRAKNLKNVLSVQILLFFDSSLHNSFIFLSVFFSAP